MEYSGQRWKKYEVKEIGLYEDGLRDVHDVLLGPHPCMEDETPQGSDTDALKFQRLVQTPRLLLACVGISCFIATKDPEDVTMPYWGRSLKWNLEGIPRWLAREVRMASQFQLERDADEAKKQAQAVKDELRGYYDEDESGSGDNEF